ncbi:MAG TPA: CHAT domain-containing tetratricopeptide repeat protein, partial [Micromonosporaceae bacterium]|nr:CHAT domain-containing tetratricopeptide repeat protein [Micromonosporaceae bacterium]
RAAGLALRELGDLIAAEARLRTAVRLAARVGAAQAAAKARMSLAFVLVERGRTRAALIQADRAADALRGQPAAQLATQRAMILLRSGRLEAALAAFDQVIPVLRRYGDDLWEARALNNRGLLYAYRGEWAAAQTDLTRARDLHAKHGLKKFAAEVEWNLGFIAARLGDAPTALDHFDRAEPELLEHGVPSPSFLPDRCELLLTIGLTAEALKQASQAVEALRATGRAAEFAESHLMLARAMLAANQPQRARSEASAAETVFTQQGRTGWALLARFVGLRAAESAEPPTPALLRAALDCAADLASAGWRVAELDARLVAARAALRIGEQDTARRQLMHAAAAVRSGPLELRVRAWYAHALLRGAGHDRRGVESALRAGMALVERQQAAVGATELRVHLAVYGAEIAGMGLGLAIAAEDPRAVLAWAERWRAGTLRLRPVRPPEDPELAEALAEVRRLSVELTKATLDGTPAPSLAAQRAAEQRVVRALRATRSGLHRQASRPPRPAELVSSLADAALVEFVAHDGRLLAVTLRAGRCRLHHLGPVGAATAHIEAAHFALRRLALGFGTARSLARARTAADEAGAHLDRVLFAPLHRDLGDRPLVVVPTGQLHPTPWGLLPSLAGRPVQVAPSAAVWLRAFASNPNAPAGRSVLCAGPELDAAEAEIRSVAEHYPQAHLLLGPDATVGAVRSAIDGADLAHIAAHATLRADNPLFSALELADGPLTVYDLERLTAAPRVVVLPACQSGVTAVRAGDELVGLVAALLALGTRTVVGTVLPVRDAVAGPLMDSFHRLLCGGARPAAALAGARLAAGRDDPAMYAAAASFVCFGGG